MQDCKTIERINELFNRLNIQMVQEVEINYLLSTCEYLEISEIASRVKCNENQLLIALLDFDNEKVKIFQKPNGDCLILVHVDMVKEWQANIKTNKDWTKDIRDHLNKNYNNLISCIPLNAAEDFIEQCQIPKQYLVQSINNNEIKISKFNGDDMVNENDLVQWVEIQNDKQ